QVGGFSEHLVQQRGSTSPTFKLSREAQQHYDDMHQPPPLMLNDLPRPVLPGEKPDPEPPPSTPYVPHGIIVGHAIASYRVKGAHADTEVKDKYVLQPGDDVIITTISGAKLIPVYDRFVVCDYFKSEMSEYDGNYVFVPLDHLQKMRTMENRATSIQIKL